MISKIQQFFICNFVISQRDFVFIHSVRRYNLEFFTLLKPRADKQNAYRGKNVKRENEI